MLYALQITSLLSLRSITFTALKDHHVEGLRFEVIKVTFKENSIFPFESKGSFRQTEHLANCHGIVMIYIHFRWCPNVITIYIPKCFFHRLIMMHTLIFLFHIWKSNEESNGNLRHVYHLVQSQEVDANIIHEMWDSESQ